MTAFRALIVAAVSTEAQAEQDRASIPAQLETCRAWCAANDVAIIHEITIPGHSRSYRYLDEIAAASPDYAELLSVVRSGAIDLVVVMFYSRLWRTMELQSALLAVCRDHGVQIYSTTEGGSLHGSGEMASTTDRFVASIHGYTAEREIEQFRARHRMGMTHRVEQGLHGTSSGIPYGYRAPESPRRPLRPDPFESQWLLWIYQRRAEGWGPARIANTLNDKGIPTRQGGNAIWHSRTVTNIIKCDYYAGVVRWGKAVNPNGLHDRIIPRELWDRVQQVNKALYRVASAVRRPLTGLCRCAYCGGSMGYMNYNGRPGVGCNEYRRSGGRRCRSNSTRADWIEAALLSYIQEMIVTPTAYSERRKAKADNGVEVRALEAELARRRAQRERLIDMAQAGVISVAEFTARSAGVDVGPIEAQLAAARRDIEAGQGAEQYLLSLSDSRVDLEGLSGEELNDLYIRLIDRIVVRHRDPVEIYLL